MAGANHPRLPFDYATQLKAKARRLGLGDDDVDFPGFVDEAAARRLFAESSLVVLPYLRTTGASGTLASAIGLDRPVVVTDLPPLVGQLNGYPNSRVVAPGDVPALADSIAQAAEGRFIARPPSPVAPGAVRRWEELVDRTADVYNSAIAARHGAFATFGPAVTDADSAI